LNNVVVFLLLCSIIIGVYERENDETRATKNRVKIIISLLVVLLLVAAFLVLVFARRGEEEEKEQQDE